MIPSTKVWQYYEKISPSQARCYLCSKIIRTDEGTTNVRDYSESEHKESLQIWEYLKGITKFDKSTPKSRVIKAVTKCGGGTTNVRDHLEFEHKEYLEGITKFDRSTPVSRVTEAVTKCGGGTTNVRDFFESKHYKECLLGEYLEEISKFNRSTLVSRDTEAVTKSDDMIQEFEKELASISHLATPLPTRPRSRSSVSLVEESKSESPTSKTLSKSHRTKNSNCDENKIILSHIRKIENTFLDWRSEYLRTKALYRESQKSVHVNQCNVLPPKDLEFLNNQLDFTALILILKLELTRASIFRTKARMNDHFELLEGVIVDLKRQICKYLLECDESVDLFVT